MSFPKRLKGLISESPYRIEEFAIIVDHSYSTVYNWVAGKTSPKIDALEKIMEVFPKIDMYWLVMGKGSKYRISEIDLEKSKLIDEFNEAKVAFDNAVDVLKSVPRIIQGAKE